jgi:uncharacterized membrane-anchored protein
MKARPSYRCRAGTGGRCMFSLQAVLFWAAFILRRPLGATLGDMLDKPIDHGGFSFSRYSASGWLL